MIDVGWITHLSRISPFFPFTSLNSSFSTMFRRARAITPSLNLDCISYINLPITTCPPMQTLLLIASSTFCTSFVRLSGISYPNSFPYNDFKVESSNKI